MPHVEETNAPPTRTHRRGNGAATAHRTPSPRHGSPALHDRPRRPPRNAPVNAERRCDHLQGTDHRWRRHPQAAFQFGCATGPLTSSATTAHSEGVSGGATLRPTFSSTAPQPPAELPYRPPRGVLIGPPQAALQFGCATGPLNSGTIAVHAEGVVGSATLRPTFSSTDHPSSELQRPHSPPRRHQRQRPPRADGSAAPTRPLNSGTTTRPPGGVLTRTTLGQRSVRLTHPPPELQSPHRPHPEGLSADTTL